MARFSERIGAVKVEIQVGSMNDPLRNSIWNFVSELFPIGAVEEWGTAQKIAADVLRVPREAVDVRLPRHWLVEACRAQLNWAQWYDLLIYAVTHAAELSQNKISADGARKKANEILAREHSGYRFVGDELAPITSETEIAEIERAREMAARSGLEGVRVHLDGALALFGKRPEPDCRNAVKEAISAVEAVVNLINGSRGGGLSGALNALAPQIGMHPALKRGLESLYGYTSDADGIRHAILEEAKVDEADALFMIVACSAVTNFLMSKAAGVGLLGAKWREPRGCEPARPARLSYRLS